MFNPARVVLPELFCVSEAVPLMMLAAPCVKTLDPATVIAVLARFPVRLSVPALIVVAPV